VRTFDIHGELENGDVASDQQLEFYRSLTQDDFPIAKELDDWAFRYFQDATKIIDVSDCGFQQITRNNIDKHYEIQRVLVAPLWGVKD